MRERVGIIDWLKIAAVVAMVLDHLGIVVGNETLRSVGRFAFPAFAAVLADRINDRGAVSWEQLVTLGVFGVVSQWPYFVLGFSGLNIFFTLALGVVLSGFSYLGSLVLGVLGLVLLGYPDGFSCGVDYGIFGALYVAVLSRRESFFGDVTGAVLLVLATWNLGLVLSVQSIFAHFLVLLVLRVGKTFNISGLRLNKWFYYVFYPVHLALIKAFQELGLF